MKQKWSNLAAFGIPFIICVIICIGNGVYPFGEECILEMDMYHQYCPFFLEFRDKLVNGGSLLYSWDLGLGSDFVSLYAYYLASPLNWLIILCPEGFVVEFMTLLILVKIAACGLTFFIFLTEHFGLKEKDGSIPARKLYPALVFSTAYALSGFVAAYSWDIMWMDSIALAPLIILGLEWLVKKNKVWLYYVTLAVSILANYYISIMICLFLVFYFILLFFEQKEGRLKATGRFALYSLLAGGTGAVLIIPEAMILGSSGSGMEFPEKMEWYFNIVEEISRVCTMAETHLGRNHWPNIYAGAFVLVLAGLYLLNYKISWKKKLPRIGMLLFFLVSFSNSYLEFFWHGFDFPDSLPARQSFLFIFVLLCVGFDQVLNWEGTKAWHIPVVWLFWGSLLYASYLLTENGVTDEWAFLITGIFLLFYGIVFILILLGENKIKNAFFQVAIIFAIGELGVNMAYTGFSVTSRTAYLEKMEDYHNLLEVAEEAAEEEGTLFYRVEDSGRKTKNDNCLYGYQSSTIFSSLMNIEVSRLFQNVYMEGGKNYYCYNGATPLPSAMLSVKYILSGTKMPSSPYYSLVETSGGQYLYENAYCLPLGFVMPEEVIDNWETKSNTRIKNLNLLAELLGAENKMLTQLSAEQEANKGTTTFTIPEDGYYYTGYDKCSSDTLRSTSTEGKSRKYSKTSHRYLMEIGKCKAGEEVTFTNTKNEVINYTLYKLSERAVADAFATLNQQTLELEAYSDTEIVGNISISDPGRLILSIPYDSGWKLYVDGEETEIEPFREALIGVHLEEGEHEIRLAYMTPGLGVGAFVSGSCVLLFITAMFIRKRRNK